MTSTWNNAAVVARVRQALMRGIVVATEGVRNEAVSLVLDTAKTGRIYRRRGVEHQASAPGEPPASDTGTLVSRTRTDYSRLGELVGVVRASAAHAAPLEYGTPRMEPRPFMRPALANRRKQIIAGLEAEVRAVL